MAVANHYDVLGVPRDATDDQIKRAYRAIARECHPDKTGGNEQARARYEQANQAYVVLSNPRRRKEYDAQIKTPQTVRELFELYPAGRRLLAMRLPSAEEQPVPGVHMAAVLEVPRRLLHEGGVVNLPDFGPVGPPPGSILQIPAGSEKTTWARLVKMGDRGRHGAEDGDFLVLLVPKT